jgi:hypothetical protein
MAIGDTALSFDLLLSQGIFRPIESGRKAAATLLAGLMRSPPPWPITTSGTKLNSARNLQAIASAPEALSKVNAQIIAATFNARVTVSCAADRAERRVENYNAICRGWAAGKLGNTRGGNESA